MPFSVNSSEVQFVRPLFHFSEVKDLYTQAEVGRRDANLIEQMAESLVKKDFPGTASHEFMGNVISWGKGNRFLGRAKTQNEPDTVALALRTANQCILGGDLAGAVDEVARLRYVGHSFASKHVRMMCPAEAGTLDSRIRDRLGYPGNADGYRAFLADLKRLKELIENSDLVPDDIRHSLRICDVEMIVYAALDKK